MSDQTSRERFEAWAADNGYHIKRAANPAIYDMGSTSCAWEVWQARDAEVEELRSKVIEECATDHRNVCTNSNEPGQKGSSWENVPAAQLTPYDALDYSVPRTYCDTTEVCGRCGAVLKEGCICDACGSDEAVTPEEFAEGARPAAPRAITIPASQVERYNAQRARVRELLPNMTDEQYDESIITGGLLHNEIPLGVIEQWQALAKGNEA